MCGIIGILSKDKDISSIVIDGLDRLSYRGYDSAGIAMVGTDGSLECVKAIGEISSLRDKINNQINLKGQKYNAAIAHTRWATHGSVKVENAHPHCTDMVAIVHNGVIENYHEVKQELLKEGFEFKSQTDTELIPVLITKYITKLGMSYQDAILAVSKKLHGSMAILAIFKGEPGKLFGYKKGSPLIASFSKDRTIFALSSDIYSVANLTDYFIKINDGEIIIYDFSEGHNENYDENELTTSKTGMNYIFDSNKQLIDKKIHEIDKSLSDAGSIGQYESHMMKEIHEQSEVVWQTIDYFYNISTNSFSFPKKLSEITPKIIKIIGCGSSLIAGSLGAYWLGALAGINAFVASASEARFDYDPVDIYSYVIYISQSGETADILAAANELTQHSDTKIFAITNNALSSLASKSDDVIFTKAGVEISVAATKTFTTQLAVFALLSLFLGRQFGRLSEEKFDSSMKDLLTVPRKIKTFLDDEMLNIKIKNISELLSKQKNILFIGRGIYYQIASEGALKLKELSYIFAESIAAGELKHGPIALVSPESYLVIMLPKNELYEKMIITIEEISARGANLIVITNSKEAEATLNISGPNEKIHIICIDEEHGFISSPFLFTIVVQLIAYYAAKDLGNNIDKPRNLAKSVTVE